MLSQGPTFKARHTFQSRRFGALAPTITHAPTPALVPLTLGPNPHLPRRPLPGLLHPFLEKALAGIAPRPPLKLASLALMGLPPKALRKASLTLRHKQC